MYLNIVDVKLTSREGMEDYKMKVNDSLLDILSLFMEFKLATSRHISRLILHKEQNTYIYLKLRRMWQAGFLESFKVFTGTVAGMPVYYVLSKEGLRMLEQSGLYTHQQIINYPKIKSIFRWNLFMHEAQVVELASREALNFSKHLHIEFLGEHSSQQFSVLSNKNLEALTPDYTAKYKIGQSEKLVYTEFERTAKSKEVMLKKVQRYLQFLDQEERKNATLRFIFETLTLEQYFWLNILTNGAKFLQTLRIYTTNATLLVDPKQFLEPVYISESSAKLTKHGYLNVDVSSRIKLFSSL